MPFKSMMFGCHKQIAKNRHLQLEYEYFSEQLLEVNGKEIDDRMLVDTPV